MRQPSGVGFGFGSGLSDKKLGRTVGLEVHFLASFNGFCWSFVVVVIVVVVDVVVVDVVVVVVVVVVDSTQRLSMQDWNCPQSASLLQRVTSSISSGSIPSGNTAGGTMLVTSCRERG